MPAVLSSSISQGILNVPGATPESKATVERLLEEDRNTHHCFYGKQSFHNHLSHHLLAAHDLGAPSKVLQAIYKRDERSLYPLHFADEKTASGNAKEQDVNITIQNWTEYLGQAKYYSGFLSFFTSEVAKLGSDKALEQYVLSSAGNGNGSLMIFRFFGGALHPLIQTGYGVEFNSDAMVAQGLAQTAVHAAYDQQVFDLHTKPQPVRIKPFSSTHRQPLQGRSLLSIFREAYDSENMHPVMPYDPDALLTARRAAMSEDGRRLAEIRRLSALWQVDLSQGERAFEEKIEELFWVATLLLAGTGKPGRKPRLDFFLMHMLNASLFVPSLFKAVPNPEYKATLLRAILSVMLTYLLLRGRPRMNPELLMSYTDTPRPPVPESNVEPDKSALGNFRDPATVNPWSNIIASVIHAPDAHTVKAIRALYYAAQRYGTTPAGGVLGAFQANGEETLKGIGQVDGTLFVRAAGVVMDTLGWVSHGQKEGGWDRSALGWEDAWKNED